MLIFQSAFPSDRYSFYLDFFILSRISPEAKIDNFTYFFLCHEIGARAASNKLNGKLKCNSMIFNDDKHFYPMSIEKMSP